MKSLLEATYGAGPQAQPQRLWVGRFSSGTGGSPRPEKQRGPCTRGLQRARCPAPPQPHPSLPQAFRSRTFPPRLTASHPPGFSGHEPPLGPRPFWGRRQATGQTKNSPWGPCNPSSTAQQLTPSFTDSLTPPPSFIPSLIHSFPPSSLIPPPSFIPSLPHSFPPSPHHPLPSFTHSSLIHSFIPSSFIPSLPHLFIPPSLPHSFLPHSFIPSLPSFIPSSFIHSLPPSFIHSSLLTQSLPSLTQSLPHSVTYSFVYPLIPLILARSLTHSFGTSTNLLSTRQSARRQG